LKTIEVPAAMVIVGLFPSRAGDVPTLAKRKLPALVVGGTAVAFATTKPETETV